MDEQTVSFICNGCQEIFSVDLDDEVTPNCPKCGGDDLSPADEIE